MVNKAFDYHEAFSRNIGWVTPDEQNILRSKRIAIAGLGGVGGSHLITLTRLGVGKFNISDMDTFGVENFNRQAGASMETVGQPKLDVLHRQAQAINPELDIRGFPKGVTEENVDAFLEDVDLYVDSLDFFAIKARRLLFAKCTEKGIPAITAAPLGMGCAYLGFLPGRMTFEEYFRLEGHDQTEQLIRFLVGLAPARLQNKYLVYPQAVDIPNHKGPSTPMAIETCAGIAGTEALKILLNRGKPIAAPWGMQFDAFRNKLSKTWRPGGNNHPIQKLALMIGRKKFGNAAVTPASAEYQPKTTIEKILDIARWAPSGDNAQPWRFEVVNESEFIIHGFDTRDEVIYDLQGHASQLAIGALLQTIEIAASGYGLRFNATRRLDTPETKYVFDVSLREDNSLKPSPLFPYVSLRSVQRRALSNLKLLPQHKHLLETKLGDRFEVIWFEGLEAKWRMTKLIYRNAGLRLNLPEAFKTHKEAIDWDHDPSPDKMPVNSLGIDPVTSKIMKWAMASWERLSILNRYFGGTILPRIQMELIPGLNCGAHFILLAKDQPRTIENYLAAGKAVQRFWLTATQLGLQLQPQYTPIVFNEYIESEVEFSQFEPAIMGAHDICAELNGILENRTDRAIYMGRIGYGKAAKSRSTRLPLRTLCDT